LLPKPPPNPDEFEGEDMMGSYLDDPNADPEITKWEQYKVELMNEFPTYTEVPTVAIPPEDKGMGLNRRVFYVTNDFQENWKLLPDVTPQEINGTRKSRWLLTGN